MPNISNLIIKARKYLEQGNIQELSQLIDENPNLISEKFEIEESENRKNVVTLLIEAFRCLNIKLHSTLQFCRDVEERLI